MFGDHKQHDAQEFMSFVLTHLDDETNIHRCREGYPAAPDTARQSLLQAAIQYWDNHLSYSQSLVDKYWRTIELSTVIIFPFMVNQTWFNEHVRGSDCQFITRPSTPMAWGKERRGIPWI